MPTKNKLFSTFFAYFIYFCTFTVFEDNKSGKEVKIVNEIKVPNFWLIDGRIRTRTRIPTNVTGPDSEGPKTSGFGTLLNSNASVNRATILDLEPNFGLVPVL
jgi:hypothetical protein